MLVGATQARGIYTYMQEEDTYKSKVMRHILISIMLLLSLAVCSQVTYQECGSYSDNSNIVPFNRAYNYNYWQGIYSFAEFNNTIGNVTAISFYNSSESNVDDVKMIEVYVKVSQTSSFSTSVWDVSSWTKVYSGELIEMDSEGWKEIIFDSPIQISPGDNLYIGVKQGYQAADGNLVGFAVYRATNQSLYSNSNTEFESSLNSINVKPYLKVEFEGFHANAGDDIYAPYGEEVILGGNPPVVGISDDLSFLWSPSSGLNDNEIGNPSLTVSGNQTYALTTEDDSLLSSTSSTDVYIATPYQNLYTNNNTRFYLEQESVVKFYDDGYSGGYSNAQHYCVKFIPEGINSRITVSFNTFNLSDGDWLKVYSGNSIDQNSLINTFTGSAVPIEFFSDDPTGSIIFEFYSDGESTSDGWQADIGQEEIVACNEYFATASSTNPGDGINSEGAFFSISNIVTDAQFVNWQLSIKGSSQWNDIPSSTQTMSLEQINTTTYYRAKFTSIHCQDDGFSNTLKFSTSNNYYVNDNSIENDSWSTTVGSSSNNGLSVDYPIDKISSIVGTYSLLPNDTVFVENGNYLDQILVSGDDEGSSAGDIVITGSGGTTTIVESNSELYLIYLFETSYIKIENIGFTSSDTEKLVEICSSDYISISKCKLSNTSTVLDINGSSDVDISRSYLLSDNSLNIILDINESSNTIIRQNWLQLGDIGINIDGLCDDIEINRNFIANCNDGVSYIQNDGQSLDIINNSLYCNNNCLVFGLSEGLSNTRLINNLLTTANSSGSYCVNIETGLDDFYERHHNLYYIENQDNENTVVVSKVDGSDVTYSSYASEGAFYSNPEFLSESNGSLFSSQVYSGSQTSFYSDISGNTKSTPIENIGASAISIVPNYSYAILKRKLDGGYYLMKDNVLRIKYEEEYSITTGSVLSYKLYKFGSNGKELFSSNSTGPSAVIKHGPNYLELSFGFGANGIRNGFYILEVTNNKDEKWYLRIQVQYFYPEEMSTL